MKFKKKGKQGDMRDTVGKMPKITSVQQALEEILYVANDERTHVMVSDAFDWLNLKMRIVKKIAKMGLNLKRKKI